MVDLNRDLVNFDIGIGELHVTDRPMLLRTVLGSCVAVTLFDQRLKIAAMNHIVLPGDYSTSEGQILVKENDTKYGSVSLKLMLSKMKRLGSYKESIIANIYGASYMLNCSNTIDVPKMNVLYVRKFLKEEGIRVGEELVYQEHALRVLFNTLSGDVRVEKIKND